MKRLTVTAAAAAAGAAAAAVLAQGERALPEPRANAVWDYLQAQDYTSWALWPGTEPDYDGTDPHGARLTTYLNDTAERALRDGSGPLPQGSIIVKENDTPDGTLAAVTVMYKAADGYNPDANNWFWLKRLPDGDIEAAGQVATCQSCHAEGDRDYIRSELP